MGVGGETSGEGTRDDETGNPPVGSTDRDRGEDPSPSPKAKLSRSTPQEGDFFPVFLQIDPSQKRHETSLGSPKVGRGIDQEGGESRWEG